MITDYHCHILPDFDDGADNISVSLAMIEKMKSQGVERIIATPHFYAHRENSIDGYLERRQNAYNILMNANPATENILLGAEVAVENGISKIKNLNRLAIQGTDYILLELPFRSYSRWIADEIYNISCYYGLKIILAHIERYRKIYSKTQITEILDMGAVLQVNNSSMKSFGSRRFVRRLIKDGYDIVFGSDCHNMTSRTPDWDILLKHIKPDIIEKSDKLIDI